MKCRFALLLVLGLCPALLNAAATASPLSEAPAVTVAFDKTPLADAIDKVCATAHLSYFLGSSSNDPFWKQPVTLHANKTPREIFELFRKEYTLATVEHDSDLLMFVDAADQRAAVEKIYPIDHLLRAKLQPMRGPPELDADAWAKQVEDLILVRVDGTPIRQPKPSLHYSRAGSLLQASASPEQHAALAAYLKTADRLGRQVSIMLTDAQGGRVLGPFALCEEHTATARSALNAGTDRDITYFEARVVVSDPTGKGPVRLVGRFAHHAANEAGAPFDVIMPAAGNFSIKDQAARQYVLEAQEIPTTSE